MILYGQKYGNFYFFLGIRQLMKTPIVKCLVHNSWKGNNDIAKPTYLSPLEILSRERGKDGR